MRNWSLDDWLELLDYVWVWVKCWVVGGAIVWLCRAIANMTLT
jgi:hypothetical protein